MNTKQKLHQQNLAMRNDRFQDQAQSGLSVKKWCILNNISIHAYNYWKHIAKEEYLDSILPDIVPLAAPSDPLPDYSLETIKKLHISLSDVLGIEDLDLDDFEIFYATQIYNGHILTPEGWVNQGSVVFSDGHITEVTKSSHIIERADQVTNVCEVKYSQKEYAIDKEEDLRLRDRCGSFKEETKTRAAIHPVLVTTFGMKRNMYSDYITAEVTLDDLFE